MLKSQMNQVLSTLERQGFLCRSRSQADRRQVELTLTPEGETAYLQAHRQVEVLLKELVDRLGTEAALALAQQLEQSIAAIQDIYAQQKGTL
jgi:DNA-binding MarR family transcriptional regulator